MLSAAVIMRLMQNRALIAGGGAPEIHISRLLTHHAHTLKGKEAYCFQAFADALEIIPTTLAENAGLNPIAIVTELRNKHSLGERNAGINVKKVSLATMRLDTRLKVFSGDHFEYLGGECGAAAVGVYKRVGARDRDSGADLTDRRYPGVSTLRWKLSS